MVPGAVASSVAGAKPPQGMSIRFVPTPSPVSIGASASARTNVRKEQTRCRRAVLAQADGLSPAKRRTSGPTKRVATTEPVRSHAATSWLRFVGLNQPTITTCSIIVAVTSMFRAIQTT